MTSRGNAKAPKAFTTWISMFSWYDRSSVGCRFIWENSTKTISCFVHGLMTLPQESAGCKGKAGAIVPYQLPGSCGQTSYVTIFYFYITVTWVTFAKIWAYRLCMWGSHFEQIETAKQSPSIRWAAIKTSIKAEWKLFLLAQTPCAIPAPTHRELAHDLSK